MQPVSETGAAVKIFVDNFNNKKENKGFPIIALQFVSLDNIIEGKMIWWNYLHKAIADKYALAVKEFTGKVESTATIKRTLINWEYEDNAYWYEDLGSKKVLDLSIEKIRLDFSDVTKDIDQSGVERITPNSIEKERLLQEWLDILTKHFNASGSTMWISLPHKDMSGDTIYSSIFCVFNKSIVATKSRVKTGRVFRNFIIDYVIDRYKEPLQRELATVTAELDANINDYKPEKFSYTGKLKRTRLNANCSRLFQSQNLPALIEQRNYALGYLLKDRTSIPGDEKKAEPAFDDFVPFHKITPFDKTGFKKLIYGRLLLLAFFVVKEKSLDNSIVELVGHGLSQTYVLDIFGIDGLKKDKDHNRKNATRQCELDKIIPFISKIEYHFLLSACDIYKVNEYFKDDIIAARPPELR
ncbi:MAG TPA: hypothetical protein VGN20_14305 [Mucilaginibacter sp.]|jgi:hypothetical protein